MPFGMTLSDFMKNANMTQRELAERVGVSQRMISSVLAAPGTPHKRYCKPRTAYAISALTGGKVSPESLMDLPEEMRAAE